MKIQKTTWELSREAPLDLRPVRTSVLDLEQGMVLFRADFGPGTQSLEIVARAHNAESGEVCILVFGEVRGSVTLRIKATQPLRPLIVDTAGRTLWVLLGGEVPEGGEVPLEENNPRE